MKKTLIIAGKLCVGGAERVARDIGVNADPAKYEIHYLVFSDKPGAYEADVEAAGCRVLRMASPSSGYWRYFSALISLIRAERYDVIHAHTMFSSGWAMLAGKLCGVPVRICHSHSIRGFEKRNLLKNSYEKIMRRVILAFATELVACGREAGEWLYGKKEFDRRGKLIYNGISLDSYAYDKTAGQEIRMQYGLEDSFVIGHVGHLAQVKNQIFLIELLPELLKARPETRLLLLGEGDDRPMLMSQVEALGLQDAVTFTGNVDNVGAYMSAMDVFAFPSLYEGMPLALIEAQANGLPCLISNKIPSDAVITDQAVPFPLEPKIWIEALLNAKRDPSGNGFEQLRKMGFDTADMLKTIYALYEADPNGNETDNR